MGRISAVKHNLYLQKWAVMISECQNSGQTVVEWCKQHNVDTRRYYYWLKQLRDETLDRIPELANINFPAVRTEAMPSNTMPVGNDSISFKRLEVQTPLPNMQAAVIVHLPSATIEVNNGTSKETVEAVLLALKTVC